MTSSAPQPFDRRSALAFIVAIGVVSLFADMAYEGMRAITGPFLGLLGASATIVGIVAGTGELAGYLLRLVSETSRSAAARTGRSLWRATRSRWRRCRSLQSREVGR